MRLQNLFGFITTSIGFASSLDPTVQISTGKYVGRYIPEFKQDVFLGIPYANKPVRFAPATPATGNPKETKLAKEYGFSCPGFGSDTTNLLAKGIITLSEDCLNLNIVRPTGAGRGLPVLVWIYGGGWQEGQTADPRYNVSYIVQQSVEIGKPIIGMSLNYRTGGFGFLFGKDVMNSGNTNLGLRDQRLALQWIQKNIKAFGGDPKKVTIWGESAGAYSVGTHLLAYGGRDDGLFRAAILESGTAVGPPYNDTRWYQPLYDQVTTRTGCYNATDTLSCLRTVPYEIIYPALNVGYQWFAVIDGAFVTQWPVKNLADNRFIKVPILLGGNTDEGISFGATGVDTDAQAIEQLMKSQRWVITTYQAEQILARYPNDPAVGSPYGWGSKTWPELGLQYKRYSSIAGDMTMEAPRRLLAETYAGVGEKVWSCRFDTPLVNTTTKVGIGHFSEIPKVFSNPDPTTLVPLGDDPGFLRLGHLMARMWVAFTAELDPNGHKVKGVAKWPVYTLSAPTNFVFRNDTSYAESDTYRKEGMAYINSILR